MVAVASLAIGTFGSMRRTASARRPARRLVAVLELLEVVEACDELVAVLREQLAVAERLESHPDEGDPEEEE